MFVGVEVAEIVGLLAELNLGVASSELFNQETVVGLDDLPYQLSWNCRHFQKPITDRNRKMIVNQQYIHEQLRERGRGSKSSP